MKAASLSRFLKIFSDSSVKNRVRVKEIIIHTGQHYEEKMTEPFFREMNIPNPDYYLNVRLSSPIKQIARIMIKIEELLVYEKPDFVLIYGDTNSSIAGSLAAVKQNIPIAHIEAGLRSYDRSMPEEINRIVIDSVSTLFFCPTVTSVENLKREGITRNVFLVGDIMWEAFQNYQDQAKHTSRIIEQLKINGKAYLLCTIHRASNTDQLENLKNIMIGLTRSKEPIILPLHPRTKKMIERNQRLRKYMGENIQVIEPVGYFDMLVLEQNAKKIITDSGGVQKEAYFQKVPCITLRENTEWVETVEQGVNRLVGVDPVKIIEAIHQFQPNEFQFDHSLFGDGHTSAKIVEILGNRMNQ